MSEPLTPKEARVRMAAVLVLAGVLVEALTMQIIHPLAFLAFVGITGALLLVAIGVYLTTLVF